MSIKELSYLETVIEDLKQQYDKLDVISRDIEGLFLNIVSNSNLEYLNISSRVKSPDSLREKILRNKYYKKYPNPEALLYNLSDLIGVRIECRFSDDEKNIYRYLRKHFNKKADGFYFYNDDNVNFCLKFEGKQPQKQKNGFTIYRIDGRYQCDDMIIPFELQIKSLVNMFWGEIEHQIIYKNSNYIIEDKFLKDIMGSIKNNLSMIDKQLLTVFNHFEAKKRVDNDSRQKHLEELVAKLVYDGFSRKMRESMGMVVNFKKSCETIVRYTFSLTDGIKQSESIDLLINALNRLNEITDAEIDFNSTISFEKKVKYTDSFSKILGKYLEDVMNNEFNWNLFFKILFILEPLSNLGDFEKFLNFLKYNYTDSPDLKDVKSTLRDRFNEDFVFIEETINNQIAITLTNIDKIDIVYDYNIYEVNDVVENVYKYIINNIETIDDFYNNKTSILETIDGDIIEIFE